MSKVQKKLRIERKLDEGGLVQIQRRPSEEFYETVHTPRKMNEEGGGHAENVLPSTRNKGKRHGERKGKCYLYRERSHNAAR